MTDVKTALVRVGKTGNATDAVMSDRERVP